MDQKIYIVPHDFTKAAEAATQHALDMARQTSASILLLHIIKNQGEVEQTQGKFHDVISSLGLQAGDPVVRTKIAQGSIFEDIGKIAKANKAGLIVMGTHGARGMQKVFGSYALKVITSSSTPFLIVQKGSKPRKFEKIVLPVDLKMESLQVMEVAVEIAKAFNSAVHIVGQHESDASLSNKIKAHMTVVRKHMAKAGVKSEVDVLKGPGGFHQRVLRYGKEIDADMYAIAYHTESLLPQFDRFAQTLLTNDQLLPTLIVNSKEVASLYF